MSYDQRPRYQPKVADPAQEKAIGELLERLAASDAAAGTESSPSDESAAPTVA